MEYAFGQIDQNFAWRHNHQRAQSAAADNQQLVQVQQSSQVAATPGETPEYAPQHDQRTNNDYHDF
jgi:hypothetical protein